MKAKKDAQKKHRSQAGFTLVEVLIVLAIIVMMASYAGVKIVAQFQKAKVDSAKVQIASYQQALQTYYLAHNMYPHSSQGLESLLSKPTVGKIPDNYPQGGYFNKKELPKDPWNNPYRYECEDYQNFSVSSDGPDGEPGTEDDIRQD